jgi:hypothetical protein
VPNESWFAVDDNNRIGITTSDNLILYDPETLLEIKELPVAEDTYNMPIYNITGMHLMCKLYPTGLLLYDYKNGRTFQVTSNDSLFSTLHSRAAWANNKLFVGAGNFLQHIPLASLVNRNTSRSCFLSAIRVFNQPYATDTLPQYLHTLTLPHNKNTLSLTFSSVEYVHPQELSYQYQLTGADNTWNYTNYLNRTVSYNNLAPGNYMFLANVKNNDGNWSHDGIVLHISIVPAWWQTTF